MTSDCNNLTFPDVGSLGSQDLTKGATSFAFVRHLPFQELHTYTIVISAYYSFGLQHCCSWTTLRLIGARDTRAPHEKYILTLSPGLGLILSASQSPSSHRPQLPLRGGQSDIPSAYVCMALVTCSRVCQAYSFHLAGNDQRTTKLRRQP